MNRTEPATGPATVYDARTITLHWVSALLVLMLWAVGQTIDFFPKGSPRITVRSLHITAGVVLGIMLVMRIAWRLGQGTRLPPADTGWTGKLGTAAHYLLYLLLLAVVALGIACVWIRGDTLFNLFTVPAFDPTNKQLKHDAVELHGLMANSLLFLACLHAAAAIWHHAGARDGVLRRMWPSIPPRRIRT
jgi:cytochrome b561